MELVTTIRDFTHDMTIRHLAPDTHVRVIIDDPDVSDDTDVSPKGNLPQITIREQKQWLNRLPHEANLSASAELVRIIETSHVNTESIEV